MPDSNKIELAYLAGFFDGEGSLGIYPGKYIVCVVNTDPRPLERFLVWGGRIYPAKSKSRLDGYRRQDKYVWQIYGAKARPFLKAILPYTTVKRSQIEIFLATLDIIPKGWGKRRAPGVGKVVDANSARLKNLKRGVA